MSSDNQISRRDLVTNLGAGIAGAAIVASVPNAQAQTSTGNAAAPFVDPTSKYPKPSYPGQSQPWPGLASKMNPRPDHGETSYKGSGRLMPEATRDVIRRARCGRSDLLPTVHQLWSNVALWDKLHFSVFTSEPVMKEDEWWEAFYDLSIRLYAYGVQQNNIWTEADGDGSRVKSGTGREQWHDALNLLRNGGAGGTMTIEGLLHQMRHDYHSNSELQLLENVYLTKIKGSW